MHVIRPRTTVALIGTVLALGGVPAIASADGTTTPPVITVLNPTSGATVGGSAQPITIKAPLGTSSLRAICDHTVGPAPVAPATWSPQASDGTITGTVDFTYCTNGSNTLTILDFGPGDAQSAPVAITVANPGTLYTGPGTSSSAFSPTGGTTGLPTSVTVTGSYLQADRITVRVLNSRGRQVDRLTANLERHSFGSLRYSATWDGRNARGRVARAGIYTLQVVPWTSAGGFGAVRSTTVQLVGQHRGHTAS